MIWTICSVPCLVTPFLAAIPHGRANGGNFQCGGKIISLRDKEYEVLAKCGDQDSRHTQRVHPSVFGNLPLGTKKELYVEQPHVEETVQVEEWLYNFGPSQFKRFLTFENGTLKYIRTGDYGNKRENLKVGV